MQRAAAVAAVLALALGAAAAWGYSLLIGFLGGSLGLYNYTWFNETLVPQPVFRRLYGIPVVASKGLMTAVTLTAAVTLAPIAVYASRRFKELREYEEQLVTLLLALPGMLAASPSTANALERAAKVLKPPFSLLVEKAARLYTSTGNLPQAMDRAFADSTVPASVRVAARSIVVAARSGGRVHEVLSRLASYMESSRRLMRLAESRLAEYKMIALLAVLAYATTAGVVVSLVSKASNMRLPGMTVHIDVPLLTGLLYYSLVTITLGSSTVIARVIHGYTPLTARYMLLLLPVGYTAFIASTLLA